MNNMKADARDAVIVSAGRTPIGRHGGALASVRPDDLLAHVFAHVVNGLPIAATDVDEVIAGCANQAGEDNRNVARMAALLAGFPDTVPGSTVNRLCGSGLDAIGVASRQIRLGEAEIVIAGGVESMSRAPWVMAKPASAFPTGSPVIEDSTLGWRFPNPRLAERFPLESMGQTAENVARQWAISRGDQDAFALESHLKAIAAQDAGAFDNEIVPVQTTLKRGAVTVMADEGPRRDTTHEQLSALRPAFVEGGTVTAGNSSSLNDGAAAIVLMSRQKAADLGLEIQAVVRTVASAGVDPRVMGIGPVPASRSALSRLGMTIEDVDLVEINEAFAAQALAVLRELGVNSADWSRVNPQGGAIALGHPLGSSGARLAVTAVHQMQRRGELDVALLTMCVGIGQGISAVLTRS